MLTLIAAAAPGTRVTARVVPSTSRAGSTPAGQDVVDITIGTTATLVTVNLSTGAMGSPLLLALNEPAPGPASVIP
jgi:hypothetical protein